MTTISASSTIGVSLNPALYTSPVVIETGVTISNPGYPFAVYTPFASSTFFIVQNHGTIIGASTITGVGIYLAPGGSFTNAASGSVTGDTGVEISGGAGAVVNYGRITDLSSDNHGDFYGVKISGGAGTVVNDGSIYGTDASNAGLGIYLTDGGSVTNALGASITRETTDISISGAGTVCNYGTIGDSAVISVRLSSGSVSNAVGAVLVGRVGIGYFGGGHSGGAGTVVNAGSIAGGVYLEYGGTVVNSGTITETTASRPYGISLWHEASITNAPGGTITGYTGVYAKYGATVTNAGTIIGNDGPALSFQGTTNNLLVLDPGFAFSGLVTGSSSASNTLELASAVFAGTITGLGSQYLRFHSIVFDPGADWSITGLQRGLAGPISGFARGDTIEMTGVTATDPSFANGILTLDAAASTLDLPGTFTSATDFHVTNNSGGAEVTVACFCAGTRILTASGEQAVEDLEIGDQVVTQSGEVKPIKWLGRRSYAGHVLAGNPALLPIRIARGAFADGVPSRDLYVSPEHALLLDGVLVPARHLVNGVNIIPDYSRDAVHYLHVELATHDIIIADGQPAETFVDCDSRAMFENASEFAALYPDDTPPRWKFCAERVEDGEKLADIRDRLNSRAGLTCGDWRQNYVPGRLIGNLEVATSDIISGWAQDDSARERPVSLEIVADGRVIARVLANAYRRDLEQAGLGSGRHAFRVRAELGLSDKIAEVIEVRRASDRAALAGSPTSIKKMLPTSTARARSAITSPNF